MKLSPIVISKEMVKKRPQNTLCTNYETGYIGGSASIQCKSVIGYGATPSEDFLVEWKQGDEVICETSFFNKSTTGKDDKVKCEVKGINSSKTCAKDHWITPGQIMHPATKDISMILNISLLRSSDYGDFKVIVKYRVDGTWLNDSSKVTLKRDFKPYYVRLTAGLVGAFVVLVICILLAVLIWNFWIHIRVAYKRSRLMKYDKDDKDWVAYLSYHYDGTLATQKEEQNKDLVKIIIRRIQKALDNLGYSYYDEHREVDFSVAVERVTNIVKKCHRMILVLTPEYFGDQWKRFHAELGFHGLLESRIGLVVVLVPGVAKVLRKKAEKDQVWQKLQIALKSNQVIHWKEKMSEVEFLNRIEYAMPKLEKKSRFHEKSEKDTLV